jgi:hypothetical protein
MKKFMNIMLAVALTAGLATITVAQDAPKDSTKKTAKKGKTKSSDSKDTTKAPKGKGKGKKSKDSKDATPTK